MKFISIPTLLFLVCSVTSYSQTTFGAPQVITTNAFGAYSVYATDLDGDGDADVLSACSNDDKIAWYENQGGGAFGSEQVISSNADGAISVYATDLDGDGDADVLSADHHGDKIVWYKNMGPANPGTFGSQQVVTNNTNGPYSVFATDLDDDGDADVLSASWYDNKIAWYENLGGGTFGTQQVITTNAQGAVSVYATDLDGDGDPDVLAAAHSDNKITWYKNVGAGNGFAGGTFGPQQTITANVSSPRSIYATDLDGDGDADVLSASQTDDRIAWYENLGGGSFGALQTITTEANHATSVYATDLDGDGDADVLSASQTSNNLGYYSSYAGEISWYENQGGGNFGTLQTITTSVNSPQCVFATDLDGDGDADVLSASHNSSEIAWYENLNWEIELAQVQLNLDFTFSNGQPSTHYFAFYSLDPLNAGSTGNGGFYGLHLSFAEAWDQLSSGLAGNPIFGGLLDGSGAAMTTYSHPNLASLSGMTVWAISLQYRPSSTGLYEVSPITSLMFL